MLSLAYNGFSDCGGRTSRRVLANQPTCIPGFLQTAQRNTLSRKREQLVAVSPVYEAVRSVRCRFSEWQLGVAVGVAVEFNAPPDTILVISEAVFTANHVRYDTIRYDTIRDAILTCARKPTWVSLIYRTEPITKSVKTEKKLKVENRHAHK